MLLLPSGRGIALSVRSCPLPCEWRPSPLSHRHNARNFINLRQCSSQDKGVRHLKRSRPGGETLGGLRASSGSSSGSSGGSSSLPDSTAALESQRHNEAAIGADITSTGGVPFVEASSVLEEETESSKSGASSPSQQTEEVKETYDDQQYDDEQYDEEQYDDREYIGFEDPEILPEMSPEASASIANGYQALGAAHLGLGVAIIWASFQAPGLLLQPDNISSLSSTLLGCLGVSVIRTASVLLHLKEGGTAEELLGWKHQRLNLLLAITSLSMLFLAQIGTGGLSAALIGSFGSLALATAAWCINCAVQSWRTAPGFIQLSFDIMCPLDSLTYLGSYVLRDMGSIASIMLVALGGLAMGAFFHITLDSSDMIATAQMHPPEILALRFCLGCSMLLLAGACHTLLDFSWRSRGVTTTELAQMEIVDRLSDLHAKKKYISLPPGRFEPLTLGVLLPTVAQAMLLLQAITLQVDVNADVWLWGPLFGTTALSAVTLFVMLTKFNMDSLFLTLRSALLFIAGIVDWTFKTFVYQWDWVKDHRAVGGK